MEDRTAFPDILSASADPLKVDYDRLNREDPRGASAVFPPPDVPLPEVATPSGAENWKRTPEPYPESAIYKEASFRWRSRDLNALSPDFSIVEIARWRCPSGHLGIISSIATHLGINISTNDPENPGAVLEIALDLPWQPWIWQVFGIPFRWWLRLEDTRDREELAPVTLRDAYELPGYAFPELPTWNDQRFGWAYHGLQPLRLLVPESHTVRLFCGMESRRPMIGGDSSKEIARSAFHVDPLSFGAQAAIQIVAPGFPPFGASEKAAAEAAAAVSSEIDDNGIAIAGRLIGTLKTYRASRGATEAARRGL